MDLVGKWNSYFKLPNDVGSLRKGFELCLTIIVIINSEKTFIEIPSDGSCSKCIELIFTVIFNLSLGCRF